MKQLRKGIYLFFVCLLLSLTALAAEGKFLVPGGHTIGMKAYAEGLVVTAVESGSPAHRAGIRQGDILREVDQIPLRSAEQLTQELAEGQTLHLQVCRGDKEKTVAVKPAYADGSYRLGACVRDSVAGIGTVTYYDPESGQFGALGHGIGDPGGNGLLPICGGDVIKSRVRDVVKGVSGTAGQLKGEYDVSCISGSLIKNTARGVFGTLLPLQGQQLPVADADEVRAGRAEIRSNVRGDEVKSYAIEIVKCYDAAPQDGRNLLIRVTDPELLAITGGIVQGMGVIDNRDNTKKPENKGFSTVTLKLTPISVSDQHRHIRIGAPLS